MGTIQTGSTSTQQQGRKITLTKVNSDYTPTVNDSFLSVDCNNGIVNINLPSAVQVTYSVYRVKKVDFTTNKINILPTNPQTIDGLNSFYLEEPNESISFISDGNNWLIF